MRDHVVFAVRKSAQRDWPAYREQLRIGLATGAALIAESAAFNVLTLMAGLLGVAVLGAFTATMNLVATVFMAAIGIGVATSVRVGAAWGSSDPGAAARAGWTGLGINTAAMAAIAIFLAPMAEVLAAAYGLNASAQAMAARAMQLAGGCILVDRAQGRPANAPCAPPDLRPPPPTQTRAL